MLSRSSGAIKLRPIAAATALSRAIRALKFSQVSDCAPSDAARSGSGWTSTMIPSAPAASAASASGATRYHLPVPCDGSAITGRWLRRLARATAFRSMVLRVAVSKVRMPRSHRITFGLPWAMMYSAESSHSSKVADRPRLSSTGMPLRPASSSNW